MFNRYRALKLTYNTRKHLKLAIAPIQSYLLMGMTRSIKSSIELNDKETKIKNVLVEFCNHYNQDKSTDQHLELRITGGWVRDKLLGNESNDIDIAINHLTGEEFTNQLYEYLATHLPSLHLKSIHTIKKNPEKSKHLETCTTKLFDQDIDFVNLRSEIYSQDSRVPIIEFGTAEQDAKRRDATLNSLFYNLNLNKIEDFTTQGLNDLKNGILRTPLPPLQTFLDDPLRVLRLIRFACRFNFIIEENTLAAMQNPQIKNSLSTKISRERVGIEIEKILMSDNPEYGLQLINYIGLFQSIFTFGDLNDVIHKINQPKVLDKLHECYDNLTNQTNISTQLFPIFKKQLQSNKSSNMYEIFQEIFNNSESKKLFWLSIVLAPFESLTVMTKLKKDIGTHVPEVILREGLRYSKKDIDVVSNLTKQYELSHNDMINFLNHPQTIKRSDIGIYLRNFKNYPHLNLIFCCFNDILQSISSFNLIIDKPVPENYHINLENYENLISNQIEKYENLLKLIKSQDLEHVYNLKPIVDGKVLSKELNIKPGPWMGNVTPEILIWQLDNPEKSAQECLVHIKLIIHNYI